jgi:dCMP deaminase
MNIKWDKRFLEMAQNISKWSKDPSTQVGAVISNKKQIVSLGYNGFPKQMIDVEEYYTNREEKYSRIIHAELNALINAKANVEGCTLYTYPFLSCDRCFVVMAQSGIVRFVSPKPTVEQISRWGQAFDKTRQYASEMKLTLVEY